MIKNNVTPLQPRIVLGIVAHPDDLDFGAGGTMAKFAKDGADIHYLILTDGSKGSEDRTLSPRQLVDIRHKEQRNALMIIGGKSVMFLNYPDGELEVSMRLKKDIVKHIRTIRPDVVVTMDPSVLFSADHGMINHPDHRAAGQATLDAVFPLARDHLAFPELFAEGCEPHKTKTVLLINFNEGNYTVDISDSFDTKMTALMAHTSQFSGSDEMINRLRSFARQAGQDSGYELAESFVRIDIN